MKPEFEIKILDIDIKKTKKLLRDLGFRKHTLINFQRYIFPIKGSSNAWLRLRTDGVNTTLTIKEFKKNSIDGVHELEIVVSDFDSTFNMLKKLGHKYVNYQENKRTIYLSQKYDAEISIDVWPLIPAYMEIEAKDKKTVQKLVEKLNPNGLPTTSVPSGDIYNRYGIDLESIKKLYFKPTTQ